MNKATKTTDAKFLYMHVLQGYYGYGHGWEDLCMSENKSDMRRDRLEYIASGCGGSFRIIERRVQNSEHTHGDK